MNMMIFSCTQLPLEPSSYLMLILMLRLVLISQLYDRQLHTITSGAFVLPDTDADAGADVGADLSTF